MSARKATAGKSRQAGKGNPLAAKRTRKAAEKPGPASPPTARQPAPPQVQAPADLDALIAQAKARQIEPDGPGAPTLYRAEFCQVVVELGKRGYSKAQMAAALDVSRMTLDRWNNDHPEFCDSMAVALTHSQAWWESRALEGIQMPPSSFNAGLWGKLMAARFPADYRDRTEVGVGGAPDMPPISISVPKGDLQAAVAAYELILKDVNGRIRLKYGDAEAGASS